MTTHILNNNNEFGLLDIEKGIKVLGTRYDVCGLNVIIESDGDTFSLALIPDGFEIIALASDLTEEEAKNLLPLVEHPDGFYGYKEYHTNQGRYTLQALTAFRSFLRSLSKDPETTLVLIKQTT